METIVPSPGTLPRPAAPLKPLPTATRPVTAKAAPRSSEDYDSLPPPAKRSTRRLPEPETPKRSGGRWLLFTGVGCFAFAILLAGLAVGGYFFFKPTTARTDKNAGQEAKRLGKYGGIEIGAKGVKAVVGDFFQAEEGYDFDLPYENTTNVGLGSLNPGASDFDPKSLDDAVAAVKKYVKEFTDKQGLTSDQIFVVSSSGLYSSFKNDSPAIARNRRRLAERIMEATGKELDTIDSRDEARYAVLACVPKQERDKTLMIDIGGGNTKGGYFETEENFVTMGISYGTSSYADEVNKNSSKPPARRETSEQLRESLLGEPIRQDINRRPGLAGPPKIYLMGGLVWALGTFTHPADLPKTRVRLFADDIDAFRRLLQQPDQTQVRKDIIAKVPQSGADGKDLAKKADEEHQKVQKVYTQQALLAGIHILYALSTEYQFAEKQLIFFRKGQYAWLMGYIVEKTGIDRAAAK